MPDINPTTFRLIGSTEEVAGARQPNASVDPSAIAIASLVRAGFLDAQVASSSAALDVDKLWADTSVTPAVLKGWEGAAWEAVPANRILGEVNRTADNLQALRDMHFWQRAGMVVSVAGRYTPGDNGHGNFWWDQSDQSAAVANDPAQILIAAPSSDPTGASGAWRRLGSERGLINVFWAGGAGDSVLASTHYADLPAIQAAYPHALSTGDQMDWLATQAILNAYPGRIVYLPGGAGIYRWNRGINIYDTGSGIYGDGHGQSYVYFTHPTEDCIYAGPEDPVATANISRVTLSNFRIACTVSNPTGTGVEFRQVFSGDINYFHIYGFPISIFTAGGTGNTYERIDGRANVANTYVAGSCIMKFTASDRGLNGWQPCYSHQVGKTYFSAEGTLESVIELGMGDDVKFGQGYWKAGVNGVILRPDAGGYGMRCSFTDVYLDGKAGVSIYGFYIPPFNQAGQNIGMVVWNGGLIANFTGTGGKNIKIMDPVAGTITSVTFADVQFGNCTEECADVQNTARTLIFQINGGDVRDCGGGIKVNHAAGVQIDGVKYKDVRDDSGVAHVHLTGTIDAAIVSNVVTKRLGVGAAALLVDTATIGGLGLRLENNTDTSGARQLQFRNTGTIADNAAVAIPVNLASGGWAIFRFTGYAGGATGEVWFRYDGATQPISGGSTPLVGLTNTVLTGTSGTDGRLNFSYVTSTGNLMVENRLGGAYPFEFMRVM